MYRILLIIFAIFPMRAFADIASKEYVVEQTTEQVKTTGNQEISGTKTYTASPVVPTPQLPAAE